MEPNMTQILHSNFSKGYINHVPSIPCGNNITKPVCLTHFDCPLANRVSMMHCAVLEKSPNWASQITKALGLVIEYPLNSSLIKNTLIHHLL